MPVDETHVADDRGHGNNLPGYRRRQIRFFFWKVLSQTVAMLFYLSNAVLLRNGSNSRFYPFDEAVLSTEHYNRSLQYAGLNMVSALTSGAVGF
jgi:hypothetical protein